MNENIKSAVEAYQCPGCVVGCDIECYEKSVCSSSCQKHVAGTTILGLGKIFLGMPKGFNRLGQCDKLEVEIFTNLDEGNRLWSYNKLNVPIWKHRNKLGHTFIKGICPRINKTFIHIFLEDCMDKIDCIEITNNDINEMD